MALRAVIYEDNVLLRESLCALLATDKHYELAGAYDNVLAAGEQIKTLQPQIILMDIDMPGMTGIEAVKQIRKFNAGVPIIMLTVFDDNLHVFEALKSGATGYLLKKHISSKLFEAMEEAIAGGAPMSPSIARMVIESMRKPEAIDYQLTPREQEILKSLSQGNSYKMIAAQFEISIDTVRTHIKKIYDKLQVHSQTEAVSKAINEKLV
ncbi:MAG TPA: response regulator transcription factor [Cyclobacteriaceae bacterium]|nr:response regulator transcription factor [Cyclobacteriaceae bacterium]